MKLTTFLLFCCLCFFANGWKEVNGNNLDENMIFADENFLQGRADVVFLLDRSGSVGAANFEIQKGFVESLLTQVAVDANATRVAIISYSNTAELHLNYILNPKTKCHLAQELQDIEYTDSGATNTAAALSEARRVLMDGRQNVNKVVIMISDGISTAGGNPIDAANNLKKDTGAQVFAFGIGKFLDSELKALASSPKHVYNSDGFQEFKYLARKIRGNPHERAWSSESKAPNCDHLCDSPYKGEANDPGCCDHHAKCSCALLAGLHTCVCLPGYFGLEGTWGACQACPRGTYKSGLEPAKICTPCPSGSTTAEVGAKSVKECHCKEGYIRESGDDGHCTLINCPPLQPPTNGGFFNPCSTTYESECMFMCDDDYEFAERDSDIRICQKNGQWSGSPPVCKKKVCNKPLSPMNGYLMCEYGELTVGKICKFDCNTGYILQGSKKRECDANKRWTGRPAYCIAVRCPMPRALSHGMIKNCESNRNPYFREVCIFTCNDGYERIGPVAMYCNEKGRLVNYQDSHNPKQSEPFCKDNRDPEIFCPKDVEVQTIPGQNYADVDWEHPTASDNSGEPTKITSSKALRPPARLEMGTTSIIYTAKDRSGGNAACEFKITVIDKEPPRVLSCPNKITVNTTDIQAQVFWEEPQFNDNSREQVLHIYKNAEPGYNFSIGSHFVYYDASDSSGNYARCLFEVIVSRNSCPYYPPPINGALVCEEWMYGQYCQVQCEARFDFFSKPAEWYVCNTDAQWETLPVGANVPWPDCTRRGRPDGVRQMINAYYYFGDCNDPEVQNAIRRVFLYHFTSQFDANKYCKPKGACSVKNVKVICGATRNYGPLIRKRRDIWDEATRKTLNVELDIVVKNDEKLIISDDFLQDFANSTKNENWNLNDILEILDPNSLQGKNSTNTRLGTVSVISSEVGLLCPPGSLNKDNECVLCSVGTFHDLVSDECLPCSQGWYQDVEGKTECEKCSSGMSTEAENSKNKTDCKAICPAGTYSFTGLETCIACPLGTFQDKSGQTKCKSCPDGTLTSTEGSQSENDCQKPCPIGFYSKTGLKPCEPCPIGYYQGLENQIHCEECAWNLTTLNVSSSSDLNCIEYNACQDISKCKNGATCILIGRETSCECPEGFTGNNCEEDIDECLREPCFNGGSCTNSDGGYICSCINDFQGEFCEDKVKACDSAPCLNGGTCFENNGGYLCSCSIDFEGANCEILEPDVNITCQNDGPCQDDTGESTAIIHRTASDCASDYYNSTCYNGGSLLYEKDSCHCICAKGFTGDLCEININECENHECFEGATCKDLIGSYECLCPPGWSGTRCENN